MAKKAIPDVLRITIQYRHGSLETDANGFAWMAAIPTEMIALLKPLPAGVAASDISAESGLIYRDYDGEVRLTAPELLRLAGLRLRPWEYHRLVAVYGVRHQWHADFYDAASGAALQPRNPLREPD